MLYAIRLTLRYDYPDMARGDRHVVRILPATLEGRQRLLDSTVRFDPEPGEKTEFTDFFGNAATTIAYSAPHHQLEIGLVAQVEVMQPQASITATLPFAALAEELADCRSVGAHSPQHFLSASPRVPDDPDIAAYARASVAGIDTVEDAAHALCLRIHQDFAYDPQATDAETATSEAFAIRRGVCQDFSHIMIAGLRALGIPAGYASGFLRTLPPPGQPRLEGADAMHAWVRAWCGQAAGWVEFDPTNAMRAGPGHIVIGYGRDYSDISPIVGVVKTSGGHRASQSVDVARLDQDERV